MNHRNTRLALAVMAALESGERIIRLFVTATAHDSVRGVAASLAETTPGLKLTEVPVDENGRIVPEQFRSLLMNGKGRVLVSLLFANNETGVIEDIAALATILVRYHRFRHILISERRACRIVGQPRSTQRNDGEGAAAERFGGALRHAPRVLHVHPRVHHKRIGYPMRQYPKP